MRFNFITLLTCKILLSSLCAAQITLVEKEIICPTEYVYPVDDDTVIPLPFITLRGKLIRHTFPGVPNYESIEDGDYPEIRWVLEIGAAEIRQLIASKYVSDEMYASDREGWVQLIPAGTEQRPQHFLNKQVIVTGYLGTLASHIHTPATIEAKEIYNDTQKMD